MDGDQSAPAALTTSVNLTGTGVPHPSPGRAGPGTLVRYGDISLQFDAGRGTVIRLEEAGAPTYSLSAMFLTHYHSDHVIDLADVTMTRWLMQQLHPSEPLTIVSPDGPASKFVGQMLDPYTDDIHVRTSHVGAQPPSCELHSFPARSRRS